MPVLRSCIEPGCAQLTTTTRCPEHARQWEALRRADDFLTGRRSDTAQWRKQRARARRRDGGRCRRCGLAKGLHVHHINGVRGDDRLENLLTLCARCHRDAHRLPTWPDTQYRDIWSS